MSDDDYSLLLEGGFSHKEIRDHLRPKLAAAGFADQEINAYFNKHQPPSQAAFDFADSWGYLKNTDSPGIGLAEGMDKTVRLAKHGFQGSAWGLSARRRLPDALTPEEAQSADIFDRFLMSAAGLVGDAPYMIAGGIVGTVMSAPAAGPAAPLIGAGTGFGYAGAVRAMQMSLIEQGKTGEYSMLGTVWDTVKGFIKEFNTGMVTFGAGGAVKTAIGAVGAGELAGGLAASSAGRAVQNLAAKPAAQTAGRITTEVAVMPTASALQELRWPQAHEFVDAFALIAGLHGGGRLLRGLADATPSGVRKLRDTYAATGQTPLDVLAAAQTDPTIAPDLLAANRGTPESLGGLSTDYALLPVEGGYHLVRTTRRDGKALTEYLVDNSGGSGVEEYRWGAPLEEAARFKTREEAREWVDIDLAQRWGVQSEKTVERPPGERDVTEHDDGRGDQGSATGDRLGGDDGGGLRGAPEGARDGPRPEGSPGRDAESAAGGRRGNRARVALPDTDEKKANEKLDVVYELVEAREVQPSHLVGFEKNPNYTLINERRYHADQHAREKVVVASTRLDAHFLMDAPDGNQGAPIVDHEGNVLGGNGRAMSILRAYEYGGHQPEAYKQALAENARRLGLDPDVVRGMSQPVLIRRLAENLSRPRRQELVSRLNDTFTHAKEKRAESVSRGERLSENTIAALAHNFGEADSLREFFGTAASRQIVDMLVNDGVITRVERGGYVGEDGLLNPDGKTLVEGAIRGMILEDRDVAAKLPAAVLGKLDAAAPHILSAGLDPAWSLTEHTRDAAKLVAMFTASGNKNPRNWLRIVDMLSGKAPIDVFSPRSQSLMLAALWMNKSEFTAAWKSYAKDARLSGPLAPRDPRASREKAFAVPEDAWTESAKEGGGAVLGDTGRPASGSAAAAPDGGYVLRRTGSTTFIPIDPNKPALPQGELRAKDATRLSDIIAALEKAFDVPIRIGKFRDRALGIYKTDAEVVRLGVANNVKTAVHEIGHHLQQLLFGDISHRPLEPWRGELTAIATQPKSGQSPLPEGFAEFVARYVVNPDQARNDTPAFYAHFESLMDVRAPELKAALLKAREGVTRWAEQPAALEVLSHVSMREQKPSLLRLIFKPETWSGLYRDFVDRLHPLRKARDWLADGNLPPADRDAYILARLFPGAVIGRATHFLERGVLNFHTLQNVGRPLAEIYRDAAKAGSLEEFTAYLVARRGLEVESMGKTAGPRREAMQKTFDALQAKYDQHARELDLFTDGLVQYVVDAGLMSPEAAALMRRMNQFHVPFYRVMEDSGGFLGGRKNFQGKNPIRRMKGSGRDIINPLESIIKNTYAFIEAAEKNRVASALVEAATAKDGAGWLVERIPLPREEMKIGAEQVHEAFWESLEGTMDQGTIDALRQFVGDRGADGLVSFWRDAARLDKRNQIERRKDGERELYQVDPDIAAVMHGLGAEAVPRLVQLLAIPARMLRAGATSVAEFIVRNIVRDTIEAGMVSRSGFVPGWDSAKGAWHALRQGDMYWDWLKGGGGQASLVSMDRTTLRRTLGDLAATGYLGRLWNRIESPADAVAVMYEILRLGSEKSEQTTRLGEFARGVKRHGTDAAGVMRAAFESRDLLDFARSGKNMKTWSTLTAFLNAGGQGLDRWGRSFQENPKLTLVKTAAYLTIPSIVLAINNYGDERISEAPAAQRDTHWLIPTGPGKDDVILRIPKPYEAGVMFASSAERATWFVMDVLTKKHGGDINKAREEAFKGFFGVALDVAVPNLLPTAAVPFYEAGTNKSLFFNRPLIPKDREAMLPEYQYTPYTSELAKKIARVVGELPGVGETLAFSPALGENTVRAWSGSLGMYAVQLADALGRKAGVLPNPARPADTLADIPFVRSFVVRNPSMGAESIQRFHEDYERGMRYLRTINGLQKEFAYEDVKNLLPYSAWKAMDEPAKALRNISQTIRNIYNAPYSEKLTADHKRQQIDKLTYDAIAVAKTGLAAMDGLKDTIDGWKKKAEAKK